MPNHIHLIIFVDGIVETSYHGVSRVRDLPQDVSETSESKNEKMQSIAKQCGRLSHIISRFKYANANHIAFAWQTRFHDRIIRDQQEFNRITEYIENNPAQWNTAKFNLSPP